MAGHLRYCTDCSRKLGGHCSHSPLPKGYEGLCTVGCKAEHSLSRGPEMAPSDAAHSGTPHARAQIRDHDRGHMGGGVEAAAGHVSLCGLVDPE